MILTRRVLLSALFLLGIGSMAYPQECQMHVELDRSTRLIRAVYDTPKLCGGEIPVWVLIGLEPDHIDMELRNHPHGRRSDCAPTGCAGWYMQALGPVGGPYQMQARSGYNNGRASFRLTINQDGSMVVDPSPQGPVSEWAASVRFDVSGVIVDYEPHVQLLCSESMGKAGASPATTAGSHASVMMALTPAEAREMAEALLAWANEPTDASIFSRTR